MKQIFLKITNGELYFVFDIKEYKNIQFLIYLIKRYNIHTSEVFNLLFNNEYLNFL